MRHTQSPLRNFVPIILAAGVALVACESSKGAPASVASSSAAPAASSASSAEVTLVTDASQVCMVNNQFMGRPQIPVQVDGKTYYGCCAMCKARLEKDASVRTALDPVTNSPVDKATAVIGKTSSGAAVYFASREHFDTFAHRSRVP